uniref:Major facilitator superfamily (MFS) profile domain-containing protein n=1 Tax=Alexandrium catenella TaxID=2925 RepID=A0A7S1WEE9_ALECA
MAPRYIWRGIFLFGSILCLLGLILRVCTTKDSKKFIKGSKNPKGTRRKFFSCYWKPLLGTALIWCLFDVVEYGLKQNDNAIFKKNSMEGIDPRLKIRHSILKVLVSRVLVIPSLLFAPWLLTKLCSKWVQLIGFLGCLAANLVLALGFHQLKQYEVIFVGLYILQLSFQSLPGVTTMAIPAQIYPSVVRGTGAAISAACGKVGAVIGSFFFTYLKDAKQINTIFWVVTIQAGAALLLTAVLTPHYNGVTLDLAEGQAIDGKVKEAVRTLYSGPRKACELPDTSDLPDNDELSSEESAGLSSDEVSSSSC